MFLDKKEAGELEGKMAADADLETLKQEMKGMSPEQQAEWGLEGDVEPGEMADAAGEVEKEFSDRGKLLAETLKTLQSGGEINDEQKAELTAKLVGEFLKLNEKAEEAGEKRETYEKADSTLKDVAIGVLAVVSTGTFLEAFTAMDERRARKGKKSVFDERSHKDIRRIQKVTKRVLIGAFCPAALPFLYAAEKLRDMSDGVDNENRQRIKEGEKTLTFEEKLGRYTEAIPKDFFKDPKNIKMIGQVVGSMGGAIGGETGKQIEKVGKQIGKNPELAATALKQAVGLASDGKLDLDQKDVLILTQVVMEEMKMRRERKLENKDKEIEIEDSDIEEMSLKELETEKESFMAKLHDVVKESDEIDGELSEYRKTIEKNDRAIAIIDQEKEEISIKLQEAEEDQRASKKSIGWLSRKDVYKKDIEALQAQLGELDKKKIRLEQTKLDLVLERSKLKEEKDILDGKRRLLYEGIDFYDKSIEVKRGSKEQAEEQELDQAA